MSTLHKLINTYCLIIFPKFNYKSHCLSQLCSHRSHMTNDINYLIKNITIGKSHKLKGAKEGKTTCEYNKITNFEHLGHELTFTFFN
jgi:hypothetical protein